MTDTAALTQVIKSAIENLGAPCGMGLCDNSQAQYVARRVIDHFSQPVPSRNEKLLSDAMAHLKHMATYGWSKAACDEADKIIRRFKASQKGV